MIVTGTQKQELFEQMARACQNIGEVEVVAAALAALSAMEAEAEAAMSACAEKGTMDGMAGTARAVVYRDACRRIRAVMLARIERRLGMVRDDAHKAQKEMESAANTKAEGAAGVEVGGAGVTPVVGNGVAQHHSQRGRPGHASAVVRSMRWARPKG